jgi:hypothetical protein
MGELEFFLLMGVLIQNSNTMELVKFLEKNQKLHIQIEAITLKVTSCRTMWKKKKKKTKKVKIQDSIDKTNFILAPCPSAHGKF